MARDSIDSDANAIARHAALEVNEHDDLDLEIDDDAVFLDEEELKEALAREQLNGTNDDDRPRSDDDDDDDDKLSDIDVESGDEDQQEEENAALVYEGHTGTSRGPYVFLGCL